MDRLPEFYAEVANLPYKPGAAKQLNEVFRTLSTGSTNTLYEAFRSSPAGLLAIVPLRWMVNLPAWTRISLAGVTVWQWLGLSIGLLLGVLFILACHRLARRLANRLKLAGSGTAGPELSRPEPAVRSPDLDGEVMSDADILAAIFAITSSARTRMINGILMPGDFAALRSMAVASVAG